jgi:hypothetical protein
LPWRLVGVACHHANLDVAFREHRVGWNTHKKPVQLTLVRCLARWRTGTTAGNQLSVLHNRPVQRDGNRLHGDVADGGRQEKRNWHPWSEDGTRGWHEIGRKGLRANQEHAGIGVLRGADEHRNRVARERRGHFNLAWIRRGRDIVAQHLHLGVARGEPVHRQPSLARRVRDATVDTIGIRHLDLDRPNHRWDAQVVLPLSVQGDRPWLDGTARATPASDEHEQDGQHGNEMPP